MNKAAQKFADGTATRRSLTAIGVPETRYPGLKRAADDEISAFRGRVAGVLEKTAEKMAKRLQEQADKIPLSQLPVAMGIVLSKHAEVTTGAGNVHQALHLHLGEGYGSALRAILGPSADMVSGKPPEPRPVDPA